MRVAITGSSGRLGRAIRDRLAREHEVRGLDHVASPHAEIVADLLAPGALDALLDGAEAVVHTAALHAPHVGVLREAEFERVNVEATQALVDAALRHGVRRIVFTSSTALYGPAGWIDEDTPPQPRTVYHRSKLAAEALLAAAAARPGAPTVRMLRVGRCFPEAVPLMAAYRLHRGIDARDVAEAHACALVHEGPACTMHVVAAETPFLREDMPRLLRDAPAVLRERAPILIAEFARRGWRLPATIDRVYDGSRGIRELGWTPRHGLSSLLHLYDIGSREVLPPGRATTVDTDGVFC